MDTDQLRRTAREVAEIVVTDLRAEVVERPGITIRLGMASATLGIAAGLALAVRDGWSPLVLAPTFGFALLYPALHERLVAAQRPATPRAAG